ncbi:diheme cytochrome c-553 [Algoriphagus sp. C2-6-M1]|uniref:c-type cytochrome n=1 Tax=Algoriphagus persicinus TaxID=3108754 RepID=UPI002B3CE578|nr:diheme cytochrome c-553 [Algoriphagus sp. C2-6-M1]MEB2779709.1 diheme cytochrome c-553 [Algoriphagus sp. C2-6-M1]
MKTSFAMFLTGFTIALFSQCSEKKAEVSTIPDENISTQSTIYNGFESQVKWGEHLVLIGGCNDCHTPKKLAPGGAVHLDTALWLAGHPAEMPSFEVDRKNLESKGLIVTQDLTEWVGPWGVSFAANLTPDETGIGNFTEEQFFRVLREGKYKGLVNSRPILPPMPWEMYRHMTDNEIKAIFAYLKTIKPVKNIVPAPLPPIGVN